MIQNLAHNTALPHASLPSTNGPERVLGRSDHSVQFANGSCTPGQATFLDKGSRELLQDGPLTPQPPRPPPPSAIFPPLQLVVSLSLSLIPPRPDIDEISHLLLAHGAGRHESSHVPSCIHQLGVGDRDIGYNPPSDATLEFCLDAVVYPFSEALGGEDVPWGEVLAELNDWLSCICLAGLDMGEIKKGEGAIVVKMVALTRKRWGDEGHTASLTGHRLLEIVHRDRTHVIAEDYNRATGVVEVAVVGV